MGLNQEDAGDLDCRSTLKKRLEPFNYSVKPDNWSARVELELVFAIGTTKQQIELFL